MLRYGPTAVERAMRMQEVILRALSGELNWLQAADILRMSPRTLRRWKRRYEVCGYDGLLDRRTGCPSPRRAPVAEVEGVLRLYRERYLGFNVRRRRGTQVAFVAFSLPRCHRTVRRCFVSSSSTWRRWGRCANWDNEMRHAILARP